MIYTTAHLHIQHHEVGPFTLDSFVCLIARKTGKYLIAFVGQEINEHGVDTCVIVYDCN
jgi:hypothetical protein